MPLGLGVKITVLQSKHNFTLANSFAFLRHTKKTRYSAYFDSNPNAVLET